MFITNTQTSIGYVNNYEKIAIYKNFGKAAVYIYTCNTICKALDEGNSLCYFYDISKAFDRVWHKGLIYNLKTVGITS